MRLAIVADDLTGALDAAAPFHRSGFAAEVWLQPPAAGEPLPQVVAVTTETRASPPDAATAAVRQAVVDLQTFGANRFYKKIDSLLRGPWVAELAAMREALNLPLALVCPAFPAQGRRVGGGKVWVRETPIGDCVAQLRVA